MDGAYAAGGSLQLAELIDQHGGPLAYDLRHELRIDLAQLVADLCSDDPSTSPWWVLQLISQLPDTSAFAAAVSGGPEWRGWGRDRHILVDLVDAVQANTLATGNFKRRPKFHPYPRPQAEAERSAQVLSLDEFAARMGS